MKKHTTLIALLVLLLGLCAAPVWAQMTGTVKGAAKDDQGKPIDGATVEWVNTDNGRKITLKTNNKGEYFSVGVPPGTYNVTLTKDNQTLDQLNKVPVTVGEDRIINFDLAKNKANAQSQMTAEQKQKIEAVQKENAKIKDLNAHLQQAAQLEQAGNYDQAVQVMQEATQMDPNRDLLWARLGDAYLGAKKYPEAVEAYNKAIAIKPTSGAYHNNLAQAYAKLNQTDKAIAEYTAAAQAEPANAATYYFNEGAILTNTGKVDDAIAAFDKTIQADPNRADAYYWKGVNLMAHATTKGDKMVAPEGTDVAFNKYLELQPQGKYADAAKQMLATIGASVQTTYGKSKSAKKKE